MYIVLFDGTLLLSSDLIECVIRTDCVPIPVSVELVVKYNDKNIEAMAKGQTFTIGSQSYKLEVVHQEVAKHPLQQDGVQYGAIIVTAMLAGCKDIGFFKRRAIILKDSSLGGIYRACGSTVRIANDFTVPRFSCLIGEVASKSIARVAQEEGGITVYRDGKINFIRLEDLFTQKPVLTLSNDSLNAIDSGFLERHLVDTFYSLEPTGKIVLGNDKKDRGRTYIPRTSARILNNLSKCLVTIRNGIIGFNPSINAGDAIAVGDTVMAVITAAHYYAGDSSNEPNQYTRIWLGVLEK